MDADALLARSDLDAEVAGRTILSGYSERIRGGGFGALDLASGTELRASLRTAQISTEAFYAKLAGKDELDAGEARHRLCERLNEAVPGVSSIIAARAAAASGGSGYSSSLRATRRSPSRPSGC